jgi:argininosuccinate lyase
MVRAKAGSVLGDLVAACAILKALPYSYNLDLQEVTPHLWRALDDTIESLGVLSGMVASASIRQKALQDAIANDNSTAVALANYLVKEGGVGQLVRTSAERGKPLSEIASSRLGAVSSKFGKHITIDADVLRDLLDPEKFLESIASEGGSNPRLVAGGLKAREKELALTDSALSGMKSSLRTSERRLNAFASGLAREVKKRN